LEWIFIGHLQIAGSGAKAEWQQRKMPCLRLITDAGTVKHDLLLEGARPRPKALAGGCDAKAHVDSPNKLLDQLLTTNPDMEVAFYVLTGGTPYTSVMASEIEAIQPAFWRFITPKNVRQPVHADRTKDGNCEAEREEAIEAIRVHGSSDRRCRTFGTQERIRYPPGTPEQTGAIIVSGQYESPHGTAVRALNSMSHPSAKSDTQWRPDTDA
jgi:hypothetical protein